MKKKEALETPSTDDGGGMVKPEETQLELEDAESLSPALLSSILVHHRLHSEPVGSS